VNPFSPAQEIESWIEDLKHRMAHETDPGHRETFSRHIRQAEMWLAVRTVASARRD
jgi:hypothetical protein